MSRLRRVNSIVVLLKNPISAKYKKAWILTMEFPELSLAPSKQRPHPPRAHDQRCRLRTLRVRAEAAPQKTHRKRERENERTRTNERLRKTQRERERTNERERTTDGGSRCTRAMR
ncbi:hypothetical protein CY35_04G032900 [Sphagnum magellanicum]|nr:hypothetical protein CY35_04G032900 [Sphagnum magellanicum]